LPVCCVLYSSSYLSLTRPPPRPTLFPYTTLFRSNGLLAVQQATQSCERMNAVTTIRDRTSTIGSGVGQGADRADAGENRPAGEAGHEGRCQQRERPRGISDRGGSGSGRG